MREYLLQNKIFQNLPDEQFEDLENLSEKILLKPGEVLISEGEKTFDFYILLQGNLSITKKSSNGDVYLIGSKKPGDLVGELSFIDPKERSATIVAQTACELIKIQGEKIHADSQFINLFASLSVAIGRHVSEALRYNNEVVVKSLESELKSAKLLVAAGRFIVSIVLLISLYIFSLGIISLLSKHMSSTTPISIALIIGFLLGLMIMIRRSGFPLSAYGVTLKNWKKVTIEALLFSIPLLIGLVLIKWILIRSIPSFSNEPLFNPMEDLRAGGITGGFMFYFIPIAYAVFCPVQEFIARGVLQSSFHMLLTKNTTAAIWTAIIAGDLLFAATHAHTTFAFAMLAFIPGLFWGWLYSRQDNLIGVSISHIIVGTFAVFGMGFVYLFN